MYFVVLCVIFIISPFAKAEEKQDSVSSTDHKLLVLQWKVSHPRNTDRISLIFRQDTVELVTNTSSYQKDKIARLGRFTSPLNTSLKKVKSQVSRYYIQLKKTVPFTSLIKEARFKPPVNPHAPVLSINEEKIRYGQPYFKSMADIIYKVWEYQWTCMECASYKKEKKSIIRTMKRRPSDLKTETTSKKSGAVKNQWDISKKRFSKKWLNCIPKGKKKVECVDPEFGIFEI